MQGRFQDSGTKLAIQILRLKAVTFWKGSLITIIASHLSMTFYVAFEKSFYGHRFPKMMYQK